MYFTAIVLISIYYNITENDLKEDDYNVSDKRKTRDDLLSQAAAHQVSSALKGLTTVFGMGTGVTPAI